MPALQCLVCGLEGELLDARIYWKCHKWETTNWKSQIAKICKNTNDNFLPGHLPANCPDEQLPPLVKLPPMTREFLGLVDSLCKVGCYFLTWELQLVHFENFPLFFKVFLGLINSFARTWSVTGSPKSQSCVTGTTSWPTWTGGLGPRLFHHFYLVPLSADTSRSFGQRQSSHCLDHQGVQNVCHSVQMFSHGRLNDWQGLPFSNGFAFRHSDLDISLTFRDIPTRLQCHSFI